MYCIEFRLPGVFVLKTITDGLISDTIQAEYKSQYTSAIVTPAITNKCLVIVKIFSSLTWREKK